jgi:hypothetical protein
MVFWLFFSHHVLKMDAAYILAGNESVVTKAGEKT